VQGVPTVEEGGPNAAVNKWAQIREQSPSACMMTRRCVDAPLSSGYADVNGIKLYHEI
jgi:hypothetical protein